jgi:hypothetical protein
MTTEVPKTAEAASTTLAQRVFSDVDFVLQDYDCRTDYGIMRNLNDWEYTKAPLLDVLRRHPDWSEQHLAVIQDVRTDADIVPSDVYQAFLELTAVLTDTPNNDWITSNAKVALSHLKAHPSSHLNSVLTKLFVAAGIRAKEGQVTSRALHKLLVQEGCDVGHGLAAKRFADLANVLRPNPVPHRFALSVHPCDFLLMSNFKDGDSCKRIKAPSVTSNPGFEEEGEYCAGVLEYMVDGCTAVSYLYDETDCIEPWLELKLRRSLVLWDGEHSLYQARLYPYEDNAVKATMRRAAESVFAHALDVADYWEPCEKTAYKDSSHMFFDCQSRAHQVAVKGQGARTICAGKDAYCIDSGGPLNHSGSLKSTKEICCERCGEYFNASEIRCTADGRDICDSCYEDSYFTCERCDGVYEWESHYTTVADTYICTSCYDRHYFTCDECGEIHHRNYRNIVAGDSCICNGCRDACYIRCAHCGELAHFEKTTVAEDGRSVCVGCVDCYNASLREGAYDEAA